jgi:hypothetical protein
MRRRPTILNDPAVAECGQSMAARGRMNLCVFWMPWNVLSNGAGLPTAGVSNARVR